MFKICIKKLFVKKAIPKRKIGNTGYYISMEDLKKANEIYITTWFGNSTADNFGSIYNNLKNK